MAVMVEMVEGQFAMKRCTKMVVFGFSDFFIITFSN